jgi:hypothetical protein
MTVIDRLLRGLLATLCGVLGFYILILGTLLSIGHLLVNNFGLGSGMLIGICTLGGVLYFVAFWLVQPLSRKSKGAIAFLILILWGVYIASLIAPTKIGIKIL